MIDYTLASEGVSIYFIASIAVGVVLTAYVSFQAGKMYAIGSQHKSLMSVISGLEAWSRYLQAQDQRV